MYDKPTATVILPTATGGDTPLPFPPHDIPKTLTIVELDYNVMEEYSVSL